MNEARVKILKPRPRRAGAVVYWMSRDQRASDNWALLYAQQLALQRREALAVVFCLVSEFLGATIRQYGFMLKGLREVERSLARKNIPFYLLPGEPVQQLLRFVTRHRVGAVVTDFDPVRVKRMWKKGACRAIRVPFYEVDAHNIVPCRAASGKQEYGAYTIRPKIKRLLPEFLDEFPKVRKHPFGSLQAGTVTDWDRVLQHVKADTTVAEVDWLVPGEKAARKMLRKFLERKLADYDRRRNDPNEDGQSNLSPYLHFGQIAPQRAALEVHKSSAGSKAGQSFLEELVVRRELSDNFCFYNEHYDSPRCFVNWAKITLRRHKKDKREYLYSLEQLEAAETHDDLWNAAQMEMVTRGKMHGFMRMYWAKKILEWTKTPGEAMRIAIYLNDKYELDGRDPNGYAGIAWSIGGVHDRPWPERKVFGKIRYMSYNGCKAKFDVQKYISRFL